MTSELSREYSTAEHFQLSEENASAIGIFCSVAKANGTNLSLSEIIQLTSLELSEGELEKQWLLNKALNSSYLINSGIVYSRSTEESQREQRRDRYERLERANSNISFAKKFASFASDANSLVISISGSTSYLSVNRDDDLDFFCISKDDAMWIFLCKALIKARVLRLRDRKAPSLCLSYIMDAKYSKEEFTVRKDGLFARDAISTMVLLGEEYYSALLRASPWMAEFFPKMYGRRTEGAAIGTLQSKLYRADPLMRMLNYFLYLAVGNYIRIKSGMLNSRFRRQGRKSRLFRLRIGPDHCIYESEKYLELRKMYSKLNPSSQNTGSFKKVSQ